MSPNVAYQPLGLVSPDTVADGCDLHLVEDLSSEEEEDTKKTIRGHKIYATSLLKRGTSISLRNLRHLLSLLIVLLCLIFVAQLMTRQTDRLERSTSDISTAASVGKQHSQINLSSQQKDSTQSIKYVKLKRVRHQQNNNRLLNKHKRPQYDNYLEAVLRDRGSLTDRKAFDDLEYPELPNHLADHQNNHRHSAWWKLRFKLDKSYTILENYVRAMKSFEANSSITLTTQATTDFMYHTVELCKRWDGPISVAVFCPGIELSISLTLIKFMRQCLPEPLSACIRDKVSWHLIYPSRHGPPADSLGFPRYHMDHINFPLFIQTGQCPKIAIGPSDIDLVKQFEIELRKKHLLFPNSYRSQFHLIYPINVLRNTARQSAETKYVLASDIELYPSIGLVPQFINMLKNHDFRSEYPTMSKYVFTLPIFEVNSNISSPPPTKQDLVKMFKNGDAIFFHKWVCDACQNFPNRLNWLQSDGTNDSTSRKKHSNNDDDNEELVIFEITRRDRSREFWEPIFIGTKEDPEYDDRLSWDGRRDKMGQMYEMCLQGYHLLVLGNAFLVHAPGIKRLDREDFNKRLDYIRHNNAIYDETIRKLREQYKLSNNIHSC